MHGDLSDVPQAVERNHTGGAGANGHRTSGTGANSSEKEQSHTDTRVGGENATSGLNGGIIAKIHKYALFDGDRAVRINMKGSI